METVEKIMVSVREFSRISGLGEHCVRDFTRIEGFPCIRSGRKILIHRQQAADWLARLAAGTIKPAPAGIR